MFLRLGHGRLVLMRVLVVVVLLLDCFLLFGLLGCFFFLGGVCFLVFGFLALIHIVLRLVFLGVFVSVVCVFYVFVYFLIRFLGFVFFGCWHSVQCVCFVCGLIDVNLSLRRRFSFVFVLYLLSWGVVFFL